MQADLRAFHAYGLHGCTVFAALTAQNPFGVSAIHAIPADFVAAQLDAVLGVYEIRALKTGMLSDPAAIAEALCGVAVDPSEGRAADSAHARELAARLHDKFGCAVLVKGGHGSGATAVDVLFDGKAFEEFSMPWIANPVSTHGTGCSLAAALAAELALGRDLPAAVRGAKAYVHDAIARSFFVGENCGVLGFAPRS